MYHQCSCREPSMIISVFLCIFFSFFVRLRLYWSFHEVILFCFALLIFSMLLANAYIEIFDWIHNRQPIGKFMLVHFSLNRIRISNMIL